MVRGISVLAVIGVAVGMAACTSGPSWDQPGRSVPANSQGEATSVSAPGQGQMMPSDGDKDFAMKAAAGGAYEVQASQVALQKSQDEKVKRIAQRMVDDHTAAGKKLDGIVQQEGVTVDDQPSADQQAMIAKLNGLSGADFDREYLSQQKTAHEQTIAMFKKEASDGADSQLKLFAMNTLPTLEGHLRMISGGGM